VRARRRPARETAAGSDIALVIEPLSVLSGASFSMDASDFISDKQPPRVGLFLLALDPSAFTADYLRRVEETATCEPQKRGGLSSA
jgi:LDH2 family malate/lactate/ureidoglycolate dehydrogenase